jgi:Na+-driven multidrug efflux pump
MARAVMAGWWATAYNAAMMAVLFVVYRVYAPEVVAVFDGTAPVVRFATDYITWVGPSYIALGVGIVLGSAIQGAGATRLTLTIDALVVVLLQVPASLVAVFTLGHGPSRLFQVVTVTYVVYALVYVAVYRRGTFFTTAVASLQAKAAEATGPPDTAA